MTETEIKSGYELETANVIIERFSNLDPEEVRAVLVHGHGPFVWGSSGRNAVENAVALELIAEMALKTIQLNSRAQPIDQYLLEKHFLRKHGKNAYYGQNEYRTHRCRFAGVSPSVDGYLHRSTILH
jgi:L-ribulose-5-phosphate 4-epimerase